MHKVLLINGPNMNLLGLREPSLYGTNNLKDIENQLIQLGKKIGFGVTAFQSNSEAELIETVHNAYQQQFDFIIINPAAYTHTSIALRDALAAVGIPFIEVHITNIYTREPFRHHSYFSDLAIAIISGCGIQGYEYALRTAHDYLMQQKH